MNRETKIKILKAELCPYCEKPPKLVHSSEIYGYGHNYGSMYWCRDCDAHVGCHKGTTTPLGRLADWDLRKAKKEAHHYFDSIWQMGKMSRSEAYKWLSEQLGIKEEFTHIGMFSLRYCKKTVEVCKKYFDEDFYVNRKKKRARK